MAVVLDTCVILDCLLENRSRHADAVRLAKALQECGEVALIPMNACFEITSGICCEKRTQGKTPKLGELEDLPCKQKLIPIDTDFLRDYFFDPLGRGQLIDLKGGDMILVAMALRHGATLITEDKKMGKVARDLGVRVQSIAEYLALTAAAAK
jgi:predicted nucleic acid-binding protein